MRLQIMFDRFMTEGWIFPQSKSPTCPVVEATCVNGRWFVEVDTVEQVIDLCRRYGGVPNFISSRPYILVSEEWT